MASVSIKRPRPCQNDIDDDLATPNFVFSGIDTFPRFLVIQSQDGSNPVTSLSPFVIEKQIESLTGTPKSVGPVPPGGRSRWLLCACSRWVRPPLYNATVRNTVPSNSLKQQKSIIRSLFFHTYRSNV